MLHKRTKKLSPGELKRLNIAEEMVHGPKLLLIDEPTTDMNPVESSFLLMTLREMVNQDRTVIAAMSQPSQEIFRLFDTLLLLSKGRVIYFGPVNGSTKFFVTSPFQFSAQNYTNPAEFLADISGGFISDNKGDFIESSLLENHYMSTENYSKLRLRFKPGKSDSDGKGTTTTNSMHSNDDDVGQSLDVESHEQINRRINKTLLPPAIVALCEMVGELFVVPMNTTQFSNFFFRSGILLNRAVRALGRRYELLIASTLSHIMLAVLFGWVMGDCSGSSGVYNATSFFAMSSMFLILLNIQFIFFVLNSKEVSGLRRA